MSDYSHRAASLSARELASWMPSLGSADSDLLPELSTLVSRSRDLTRNHGVASGAMQTMVDNVVGTGFRLVALPDYRALGQSKEWADEWSRQVESLWRGWADYLMRLTSTKLVRNGQQEVMAAAEDVSSYDFYNPAGSSPSNLEPPVAVSATRLELLDLPAFPTDGVTDAYMRYGVAGLGASWTGSAVYRSDDGGANYGLMQAVTAQAVLGAVLNVIPAGSVYAWDDLSTIDVLLMFGELQSITDLAVLNGANACVIGNEIIQFRTATLIGDKQYRLSGLLRGRLGTEWAVSGHIAGESGSCC